MGGFVNIGGRVVRVCDVVLLPVQRVLQRYCVRQEVIFPVLEIRMLVRESVKACCSGSRTYVHWYETDGTLTPVAERAYVAEAKEVGGCVACSQVRYLVQGASYLIVGDTLSRGLDEQRPTPNLRQVFITPSADLNLVANIINQHMSVMFSSSANKS